MITDFKSARSKKELALMKKEQKENKREIISEKKIIIRISK